MKDGRTCRTIRRQGAVIVKSSGARHNVVKFGRRPKHVVATQTSEPSSPSRRRIYVAAVP